jgi:monoamine oxidase
LEELQVDVCIIGAGYAGLTAARRLTGNGRTVVVLEARDRVGGRTWTPKLPDGTPVDIGGTWVGPNQAAIRSLAREVGVGTHSTYSSGEHVIVTNDRVRRYEGLIPRLNPLVLLSLSQAMSRLDSMARAVPVDAPWTGRTAKRQDSRSIADWLTRFNVPTTTARDLIEAAMRGLWTSDLREVSMLHALTLIASADGFQKLLATEGGYQDSMFVGGAQETANRVAAELGDRVRLGSPVEAITQDDHGVTVRSGDATVRAQRAILSIPPSLAGRIAFDPPLPASRASLNERLPGGTVIKAVAVFDEPFWRKAGLSGASAAPHRPIETTLDASPAAGYPGLLCALSFGPIAERLAAMSPDDRRSAILEDLVPRFGPQTAKPEHYLEVNWKTEEWSGGCYMAHAAPGVLTSLGPHLREATGRIHWATTETAGISLGTIDGAVRSGERVSEEVLPLL